MGRLGSVDEEAAAEEAATCDAYVECVCDLGKSLMAKMDKDPYEATCKAAKKLLTKAHGQACEMALDAFRKGLKSTKESYESLGVTIPSSCQ